MAGSVRRHLDAVPELEEVGLGHAGLHDRRGGAPADPVGEAPLDAVVRDLVSRPEGVGVVGERPVLDAEQVAHAVAAEPVLGGEDCCV